MNIFNEKSTRRTRKIPEDLVLKPEVEVKRELWATSFVRISQTGGQI